MRKVNVLLASLLLWGYTFGMDLAGYNDKVHCVLKNEDKRIWSIKEGKVQESYEEQVREAKKAFEELHRCSLDSESLKGLARLLLLDTTGAEVQVKYAQWETLEPNDAANFKEELLTMIKSFVDNKKSGYKVKISYLLDSVENTSIKECIYYEWQQRLENRRIAVAIEAGTYGTGFYRKEYSGSFQNVKL